MNFHVLIHFHSDKDCFITKISVKSRPKAKEEAWIQLRLPSEQVPVCTSIVVSGISDNTTRDAIELYFESRKYGGGPVERVELLKGGRAVVVFQGSKRFVTQWAIIFELLFQFQPRSQGLFPGLRKRLLPFTSVRKTSLSVKPL